MHPIFTPTSNVLTIRMGLNIVSFTGDFFSELGTLRMQCSLPSESVLLCTSCTCGLLGLVLFWCSIRMLIYRYEI